MTFSDRILWLFVFLLLLNLLCGTPQWLRWQVKTIGPYLVMCDYQTGRLYYPTLIDGHYEAHYFRSGRTMNKICNDLIGPY